MAHVVTHNPPSLVPDLLEPGIIGPDEYNNPHFVTIDPTLVDHNSLNNLTVGDPHTQYHTDARALTWLGTRSTSDLVEGTNLYYTNARADARVVIGVVTHVGLADPHVQYFLESAAAALARVDDTNVTLTLGGSPATALLAATSITVGWAGTLAAARLNANVVQAITNDTNVTGSIATQTLTLGWTGLLSVARGGTGAATFTTNGLLLGNGTGVVQTVAVNAGTKQFLTQTSSAAPSWGGVVAADLPANGANPTAGVGLAAVNGSASTWMRSDAAPPLEQNITPTWSATHQWNAANIRVKGYVSVSNVFIAPINITEGDITGLRGQFGTDATIAGARAGTPVLQVNKAVGTATGRAVNNELPTGGLVLRTPTAATNGVQALSPPIEWVGRGWKTNGGSSVLFSVMAYAVPLQSISGDGFLAIDVYSDAVGVVPLRAVEIGSGYINIVTGGLRIGNVAAQDALLVGNGTNFVSNTLAWTTRAYASTDFTASAGTWTVDSGDLFQFGYVIIGKTMTVSFSIFGSSTSSTPQFLNILIPGGKSAARYVYTTCVARQGAAAANEYPGAVLQTVAGDTKFYIRRDWSLTVWAASTNDIDVVGEITFEIN